MRLNSRTYRLRTVLIINFVLLIVSHSTYGYVGSETHQVSIQVPHVLSFSGDKSDFQLTFEDWEAGSESNVETVTYSVQANNVIRDKGVVQAILTSLSEDISMSADVGTYMREGGNAVLAESNAGYVRIKDMPVDLCDKLTESGTGRVLRGKILINYKALSLKDLESGDHPLQLQVTLIET